MMRPYMHSVQAFGKKPNVVQLNKCVILLLNYSICMHVALYAKVMHLNTLHMITKPLLKALVSKKP